MKVLIFMAKVHDAFQYSAFYIFKFENIIEMDSVHVKGQVSEYLSEFEMLIPCKYLAKPCHITSDLM